MSRPPYIVRLTLWRAFCLICNNPVWRWHGHTGFEVQAWSENQMR